MLLSAHGRTRTRTRRLSDKDTHKHTSHLPNTTTRPNKPNVSRNNPPHKHCPCCMHPCIHLSIHNISILPFPVLPGILNVIFSSTVYRPYSYSHSYFWSPCFVLPVRGSSRLAAFCKLSCNSMESISSSRILSRLRSHQLQYWRQRLVAWTTPITITHVL